MTRSATATKLGAALAVSLAFAQAEAPPKVILLVGPPGSGKTTQAKILAKKFAIPSFSMAELVKQEMASRRKDAVSKALAANIASGDLLSDDAATELIRLRLLHEDLRRGFILDGYPATAGQAKALDRMLEDQKLPKALVVVLDAPDDVIRKRMVARKRADDKPDIIERRIGDFRHEASLLAAWAGHTHVVRVNGNASIADVSTQIMAGLEDAWSKTEFQQRHESSEKP